MRGDGGSHRLAVVRLDGEEHGLVGPAETLDGDHTGESRHTMCPEQPLDEESARPHDVEMGAAAEERDRPTRPGEEPAHHRAERTCAGNQDGPAP